MISNHPNWLIYHKLGYYTMDFDDLEKKAKNEKVSLCIFCNPHNPSGRVWTPEELKRFGDICLENKESVSYYEF